MELRLFIPDSPKRAWSALKYYVGARKSPVRVFGLDDYRRAHMAALELRCRLDAAEVRISALSEELLVLKRRHVRDDTE